MTLTEIISLIGLLGAGFFGWKYQSQARQLGALRFSMKRKDEETKLNELKTEMGEDDEAYKKQYDNYNNNLRKSIDTLKKHGWDKSKPSAKRDERNN